VREQAIELRFCRWVLHRGGIALKLINFPGVPDRLVLWEGGRMYFAEFKSKGGHLSKIQKFRHKQLKALGFRVVVHNDAQEAIDDFEEWSGGDET